MAENCKVIAHKELCATTAASLGGDWTAEKIDTATRGYMKTVCEVAKENAPSSAKESLVIQSVFGAYKVNYVENGTVKNADGTVTQIGVNRNVNIAVPNTLLKAVNGEAISKVGNLIGAIGNAIKATKSA